MDPSLRKLGRMDGRTVLTTGASSGIGAGIAREFALAGAHVYAAARRVDHIAAAVGVELVDSGSVSPIALDVTDQRAVAELAEHLASVDPIDTLVCAAGVNVTDRRIAQLTLEDWHRLVSTNLDGVFYCITSTLDQIRAREGDIVIISSVAASWPDHSGAGYGATKSGLLGLARGVGIDEHMNGVRVTTILPGIVDTPILDKRPIPPRPEVREWSLKPEDIAASALLAVTLPARANIAEMTLVSTRLQSLGKTQQANPELPSSLADSAAEQ